MMKIPRTTKSPVLDAQLLCYHQNALPNMCTLTMKLADGNLQAYTCFNNALQSFLASIEKSTSLDDITKDQLEDLFLNAGTVQMVVNNSMHVIDQFLPKAM